MQASRSDGFRESHGNFTDCKERIDAFVTRVETADAGRVWCKIVKSELRMHNYHSEQGRYVRGIDDMPSDGSVADNIAVLADASARSKNMDRIRRPSLESQQVLAQVIRNVLRRMQTNFLALAEKAVAMTVIIKFWKEKNPQSGRFEALFSDARILLFQFHALT
ncbi:hypothetical protein PF010_g20027 [Phytophthora fragariae]|uniref:Uncharacterized protein n=1 Tax=Phytophthora fragariae TaxID=53985 RepID=A0A6A3LRY5_9STRA|nr:hypothetical protein PF011_g4681 [Phytophthora fragariae]KAE9086588.1 hypothetical protein PF010_g20027 [Phytophthora fragariae]KAE9202724.1 hypothetical protein PF004_g18336 [Phytophthora fragariae]